jgi:hypothetical protein
MQFPMCFDNGQKPVYLQLSLLPAMLAVGTDKGGVCAYFFYPQFFIFPGIVLDGYPILGNVVLNQVKGISWGNMGNLIGLIAIIDIRT